MKRLIVASLIILACCQALPSKHFSPQVQGESVVMLVNATGGGGTGFSVLAPSGEKYILTNAHVCRAEVELAITNSGESFPITILEVSETTDLCLLAGSSTLPALEVASQEPASFDIVHILGYGMLLPLTLSEGTYVGRTPPILSVFMPAYVTATILPGNSGSPVMNDRGEVVGVVFASGLELAMRAIIVPIEDVQELLQGR